MTDGANEQILQAIKELSGQMNDGFRKIDERFEAMEKRFDSMEAKQQKMQHSIDILAGRSIDNEADIAGIKKAIGQY